MDFAHGQVDLARLASHGLVLVGYAAVVALAVRETGGGGFFPHARGWLGESMCRVATGSDDMSKRRFRADDQNGRGLRPTARRDAA